LKKTLRISTFSFLIPEKAVAEKGRNVFFDEIYYTQALLR